MHTSPATRRAAWAVATLVTVAVSVLIAHEGHTPLPTRGAQVDVARGQLTLSKEARDALDVQTAEVERRPVEETILAYATLVAPWQRHAFASSRLGGRIAKLNVRPGQTVKPGEILAEIRSLELETFQFDLLTAHNEVRLSGQIIRNLEDAGNGAIPAQTILEARNRLHQARNSEEVGRVKWASLGLSLRDRDLLLRTGKPILTTLPVRSPIGGTILHADWTLGRVVEPAEHLFEIVDTSTVWVQIGVLEKDLSRIEANQPVELRLSAYPGKAIRTTVHIKGSSLDPLTHLNTVWAELTNPAGREPRFLPGMSGQARLIVPATTPGVAIPSAAVIHDGAETYVLVEEAAVAGGSQFQKRNVVLGSRSPGWVLVRPGELYPGDRVVTRGGHQLASFFVPTVLKPSAEAARGMGLVVESAGSLTIETVLEVDGAVELPPSARASASSPLPGSLVRIHVDRGQKVKAGDVIGEVQSLEVQNLQIELLRAHLDGQVLEDTLKRLRAAESGVPRRRILEAESQVRAGRQSRGTLRRKLLVLGFTAEQIDRMIAEKKFAAAVPVRSPIDGVVVSFDRVLGQAVKAEESLFTIHDLSRPLIVGYLGEPEAVRVRIGQRVRVRLRADTAFVGEGKVVRSDRVLGADSRTMSVWVELDRPPARRLRHGQLARLSVRLSAGETTLAVPLAAVLREGTRSFVFMRKADGSFDRRRVELGRADDLHVEVRAGLRAGENIVVRGTAQMQTAFAVVR